MKPQGPVTIREQREEPSGASQADPTRKKKETKISRGEKSVQTRNLSTRRSCEQCLPCYEHVTTVPSALQLSVSPQGTPWRLNHTSCAGHVRTRAQTPIPRLHRAGHQQEGRAVVASSPVGPSALQCPTGTIRVRALTLEGQEDLGDGRIVPRPLHSPITYDEGAGRGAAAPSQASRHWW